MNLFRLYGKNIPPSCAYCLYADGQGGDFRCEKGKSPENGACKAFEYEPTLREPKETPSLGTYSPEDFQL